MEKTLRDIPELSDIPERDIKALASVASLVSGKAVLGGSRGMIRIPKPEVL